jgi:hypothetical protein
MVQPIGLLINFHMNTSGGGPSSVVSTSLLSDGIKSRIHTRSVALRRRSAGHHQDLRGETGADANQNSSRGMAAHSTRKKELGGCGA